MIMISNRNKHNTIKLTEINNARAHAHASRTAGAAVAYS